MLLDELIKLSLQEGEPVTAAQIAKRWGEERVRVWESCKRLQKKSNGRLVSAMLPVRKGKPVRPAEHEVFTWKASS